MWALLPQGAAACGETCAASGLSALTRWNPAWFLIQITDLSAMFTSSVLCCGAGRATQQAWAWRCWKEVRRQRCES